MEREKAACCISHAFARAASSTPDKIAIIDAVGGFSISPSTAQNNNNTNSNEDDAVGGFSISPSTAHNSNITNSNEDNEAREREHPFRNYGNDFPSVPVYAEDVVYTFGELQSAVNTLCCRIVNILGGGHDPHLINPTSTSTGERTFEQTDATYKHVQNSVNISGNKVEQILKDVVHSTSPNIVGIYIGPSVEYIVALLAVLQSGGALLPIDPSWPKERVLAIVLASKVHLIIMCNHASSSDVHETDENELFLEAFKCPILCLSYGYIKGSEGDSKFDYHMTLPCQSRDQRMYCYVMYTSGSTGKPKGICGTEKGLLNRFLWMEILYPFLAHDISCFKTAISFIDHFSEIFGSLLSSTTLVIPSFQKLRGNPLSVFDTLKAYRVTRLTIVPSLMRAFLPCLQSPNGRSIRNSLRVLVLSGEVFPIWLWEELHKALVDTTILNLYGSTEVSGDCAYFDCTTLSKLLEDEPLNSVPIGKPIQGCELFLAKESGSIELSCSEGEIWVGGKCLAVKYLDNPSGDSSQFINLNISHRVHDRSSKHEVKNAMYFRTGDFARKLSNGNYVFLGRKDRMIKVNGQRIALEEIEYNLRKHPYVADAAVSFHYGKHDNVFITAYIVLKGTDHCFVFNSNEKQSFLGHWNGDSRKSLHELLRSWLEQRLPATMIPCRFHFIRALPLLPSGKIDYAGLPHVECIIQEPEQDYSGIYLDGRDIQIIKQVFRRILMVEEIFDSDDFFLLGGTSISAAHIAHTLGIDMHFIYKYPSPIKLCNAMLEVPGMLESIRNLDPVRKLQPEMSDYGGKKDNKGAVNLLDHHTQRLDHHTQRPVSTRSEVTSFIDSSMQVGQRISEETKMHARLKNKLTEDNLSLGSSISQSQKKKRFLQPQSKKSIENVREQWVSNPNLPEAVAFTRCNKIIAQGEVDKTLVLQNSHAVCTNQVSGNIFQHWKVLLRSCVDASPLLVIWGEKWYIFIGSHANNFLCIDASSGEVQWEAELGGRVECTAAVTNDFTQVVVGCYNGTIYFLSFLAGKIIWKFQTGGEVKSEPIVDKLRGLIWCGSHDHNLYVLDPQSQSCVFKLACAGSIFGAPVHDLMRSKVYVATTRGRVMAVNLEVTSISLSWSYESQAPIFGSLAVESCTGYVICSMVNGDVLALSPSGMCVWKARTGGPIFCGPCISPALSSQVLICSRDGFVYAFGLTQGNLLWKHFLGKPITSSAYVDETIELISQHENQQETIYRLVCVCSSSGTIQVLKVDSDAAQKSNIAAHANFIGLEEHNFSVENTELNQTEGQTQDSSLKKYFTNTAGNCEDQNLTMQLIFSHEFAKMDLPGEIFSSPVMVEGRIFVGCRDDHVYCIGIDLSNQ